MIPPLVILAGGLATRLYPVTLTIPKSLIEVAGRPFIHHQLDLLKEKGVTSVFLCVGKFGDMIEDYVGSGERWGIDVRYSYDGDPLLGTGGAIKKIIPLLPGEFMIMYGDSYLDTDYSAVFESFSRQKEPVVMTVFRNKNKHDSSNISMNGGKIIRYDKIQKFPEMEFIDYGLLVVNSRIFEPYPSGEPFDLSIVLSELVKKGNVAAFEVHERFYEIGSLTGIEETAQYISNRKIQKN